MATPFQIFKQIGGGVVLQSTLTPVGEYDAGIIYIVGQAVSYEGRAYAPIQPTQGNLPTNTTYWMLLADKGADGAPGAPGGLANWVGAWGLATEYAISDTVSHNGSSYSCKLAHTSGASSEPGAGASWGTYWQLSAQKGTDGVDGGPGADGSNGVGVPVGGTAGQKLSKIDGTDFNTEWVDVGSGAPSVNVEALSGEKTLTISSEEIQVLSPGGSSKYVNLPTTGLAEGARFLIVNNGYGTNALYIRDETSSKILEIYYGGHAEFYCDGTAWKQTSGGGQSATVLGNNAAGGTGGTVIGYNADAKGGYSVAVGASAYASGSDVIVIGGYAQSSNSGIAIGISSVSSNSGIAIGYGADTNNKHNAIALGKYSKAYRIGELTKAMGTANANDRWGIIQWFTTTYDATPAPLYCDGGLIVGALAAINANSVLGFEITVVAKESATNDCKMWTLTGLIKRDTSNNTAIVGTVTKTVIAADAGASSWDINATADDTNEVLALDATGEASSTIKWAATGKYVEIIF